MTCPDAPPTATKPWGRTLRQLRTLTRADVVIHVDCESEDLPVRGNLTDSGDPEADAADEDRVLTRLEYTPWAWCVACVTVQWRGWTGRAYLGGCSYEAEEDFRADPYFDDMVGEALNNLQTRLESDADDLESLRLD